QANRAPCLGHASQHAEITDLGWVAIDKDVADAPAGHSDEVPVLTITAGDGLAGNAPRLLGHKKGRFPLKGQGDIAWHGNLAEQFAEIAVVLLSSQRKLESPGHTSASSARYGTLHEDRGWTHRQIPQRQPIFLTNLLA